MFSVHKLNITCWNSTQCQFWVYIGYRFLFLFFFLYYAILVEHYVQFYSYLKIFNLNLGRYRNVIKFCDTSKIKLIIRNRKNKKNGHLFCATKSSEELLSLKIKKKDFLLTWKWLLRFQNNYEAILDRKKEKKKKRIRRT